MAATELELFLVLFQMICVIAVFAYLFTRSRFFAEVLDGHPVIKTQIILTLFFGAISIYGTISGIEVYGAIINVRDLGPMVAGLTCGPWVGLGAGLIGAAYRLSLGGFTAYSCSLATVLAGLFGGLIWLWNKKKFVSIRIAVLFAAGMEVLHMLLTLAICRPFDQAVAVVSTVAIPMILANSLGMFIFAFIVTNLIEERKMRGERDSLLREMERKRTELAIATEIQQSFLPDTLPQVQGFDLAGKSVMAKEVGGDFFDVIPFEVMSLQKGRHGILIADVSGKGIPAAIFMALSRVVVRANALWHTDPADVLRDANATITQDSRSSMFVTLFYGVLNAEDREFTYTNAGHNRPLLIRHTTGVIEELMGSGIALGVDDHATYTSQKVVLSQGDVLLLYTDGVTEAINPEGELFGESRLKDVLSAHQNQTTAEIIDAVLGAVNEFAGNQPQEDDITLLVLKAV